MGQLKFTLEKDIYCELKKLQSYKPLNEKGYLEKFLGFSSKIVTKRVITFVKCELVYWVFNPYFNEFSKELSWVLYLHHYNDRINQCHI